jgi:hypothetical protein
MLNIFSRAATIADSTDVKALPFTPDTHHALSMLDYAAVETELCMSLTSLSNYFIACNHSAPCP